MVTLLKIYPAFTGAPNEKGALSGYESKLETGTKVKIIRQIGSERYGVKVLVSKKIETIQRDKEGNIVLKDGKPIVHNELFTWVAKSDLEDDKKEE